MKSLRDYFRKSDGFFADHIKRYSKSRRKAPIYWRLGTASGSYQIYLYYHRFSRDTLYKALNDYARPKLRYEEQKLTVLRQEAGELPTPAQRRETEAQEALVEELRTFVEELEIVTPLWNPDLNDGVIINFAPLWRLVGHTRTWQKECRECWDSLVRGDYDWAHLAMHLWPERVVPKCRTDRSLAIAHGLDEVFWETTGAPIPPAGGADEADEADADPVAADADEDPGMLADSGMETETVAKSRRGKRGKRKASPKWLPRAVSEAEIQRLIAERTSPAVKSALKSLLEASGGGAAATGGRRGRKARK